MKLGDAQERELMALRKVFDVNTMTAKVSIFFMAGGTATAAELCHYHPGYEPIINEIVLRERITLDHEKGGGDD